MISVIKPVIFTIHGLSVYLYAVALWLFMCILLFIIHWRTNRNKEDDESNEYEPVITSINDYVEEPVQQQRKESVDEVDEWHYPINDLKNLQYNTVLERPPQYEEVRVPRQSPSYSSYTDHNEMMWDRFSHGNEQIHPPQRGYYQPGTPLPVGYDAFPQPNRYSHYDNVPNQNRSYSVNYLKNSDLVQV